VALGGGEVCGGEHRIRPGQQEVTDDDCCGRAEYARVAGERTAGVHRSERGVDRRAAAACARAVHHIVVDQRATVQ
jgi:hypothetical protein